MKRENFKDAVKSHKDFSIHAGQEVLRAERYSNYISLLIIEINGCNHNNHFLLEHGNDDGADAVYENLWNLVCNSVRITDYVSEIKDGKMGLLLVETPPEGVQALLKRLKTAVNDYMGSVVPEPREMNISFKFITFPDRDNGKQKFSIMLNQYFDN